MLDEVVADGPWIEDEADEGDDPEDAVGREVDPEQDARPRVSCPQKCAARETMPVAMTRAK